MYRVAFLAAEVGSTASTGVPVQQPRFAGQSTLQSCSEDISALWPTYGDRFPQTEHHFLADRDLDGPTAAVK